MSKQWHVDFFLLTMYSISYLLALFKKKNLYFHLVGKYNTDLYTSDEHSFHNYHFDHFDSPI